MLAPVSVVAPGPDWLIAPVPEITPETDSVPDWIKFTVPASAMLLLKVDAVGWLRVSAAPLATVIALTLGSAPAVPLPICKVPAVTFKAPVRLLVLVSVSVPLPFWVSPKTPGPFCNVPEKVVEVLLPPVVSVAAVPLSVTIPAPARLPMLLLKPARSIVAPLASVTAELLPKALVDPALSVPPLITVAPV